MFKISVIMPVYNAEKYLKEALDSIFAQTLTNFELICIDDGSTDNSKKILQQYSMMDDRLRIISSDNYGAGHARNVGIEEAKGEYLLFLDADDITMPEMLDEMYRMCVEQNLDVVVCRHKEFKDGRLSQAHLTQLGIKELLLPMKKPFGGTDIRKDFFNAFVWWPWDKLFKRHFILDNEIRFQECRTTNDLYFVAAAMLSAGRINCLDEALIYHRISNPESLEGTRMKSSTCFIEALTEVQKYLYIKDMYMRFKQDFLNYCVNFSLWQIETLPKKYRPVVIQKIKAENWYSEIRNKLKNYFYKPDEYEYFVKICQDDSAGSQGEIVDNKQEHEQEVCELAVKRMRKKKVDTGKISESEMVIAKNNPKDSKKDSCLLSVIVAVSCESYMLEECLNGLKSQDIPDMEIICVLYGEAIDNDAVIELVNSMDDRCSVIVSNDDSQVKAWQTGFAMAQGKYIWFCLGSDYLIPSGLKKLCNAAVRRDLDLLLFEAEAFGEGIAPQIVSAEAGKLSRHNVYPGIYRGDELFRRLQSKKDYLDCISLCLLSRKLLEKNAIEFKIQMTDDVSERWLFFQLMLNAKKVMCLSDRPYQKRILSVPDKSNYVRLTDMISLMELEKDFAATASAAVAADINTHIQELIKAAGQQYRELSEEEKRKLAARFPSIQKKIEEADKESQAGSDEKMTSLPKDAYKQPTSDKNEEEGCMLVYGCGAHLEDMLDWNPDLTWRITRIFDKNKEKIGKKLPRVGVVVEPPSAMKDLPAGTQIAISAIRYFDEISKEIRQINPQLICWDIDEYHERLAVNARKAAPTPAAKAAPAPAVKAATTPAAKSAPAPAAKKVPVPVAKAAPAPKSSALTALQRQRLRGREAAMRWRQNLLMEAVSSRHVFWGARGERSAFLARRFAAMMVPGDIFIDEDKGLCGQTQMGLPICQLEALEEFEGRFIIIVLSENYARVRECLLDYGYIENVNFVEGRMLLGEDENGLINVPCLDKPRSGMIVYGWGEHIADMLHWHPQLKNRIARVIDKDINKAGMKLPGLGIAVEHIEELRKLPSGTEISIAAIRHFEEIKREIHALNPGLICRNIDKIWEEYI